MKILKETFLIFKLHNLTDYCEFINPYLNKPQSDPLKYIKVGKEYKVVDFARSPDSKFYNKYIPYYKSAPIIKDDIGRLIMIYYDSSDFLKDTVLTYDENGFVELEDFPTNDFWLTIIDRDISKMRNEKINDILGIKEDRKNYIENMFNGDFSIFGE